MKIPHTIADSYKKHKSNAEVIEKKFYPLLEAICKKYSWHISARIKEEESFAQKYECIHIDEIDDVFACTIIVKNLGEISKCCDTLRDNDKGFRFIRQKPVNLAKADSQPETFMFDSIRMYFYPPKSDLQDEYWENEVFEIQIKTLLDEAWSKASHDFTYKTTEELSWAKRRVVSQIKALLEHIEISLVELERISSSGLLTKEYDEATKNNEIIAVYKYFWSDEFLPKNLKRLAENTIRVLKIFNLTKDDLEKILNDESSNGRGNKLMNLSPYWILIQSLINIKGWDHFQSKFKPKDKKFPLIKELNIGSIPLEEALSSNNELKSKFIIR